MSRLKLFCISASSLLTGAAVGKWWGNDSRRRPTQAVSRASSNSQAFIEDEDFFPFVHSDMLPSVNASTIFYPPPPASTVGSGDIQLTSQKPQPLPVPKRSSQMMKFGFPTLDQLKWRNDYVLSYDRRNKTANWVFEHLTDESCRRRDGVERKLCNFKCDPSVHPYFQSSDSDYKHSGFDRGHLAAAGNHRASLEDCQETFYYSNMAPQVGEGFNRGAWNSLEKMMRSMAKKNPNVYVVTGPLYLPRQEPDGKMYVKYQVIGRNQVSVPTHFFKVAVVQTPSGTYELHSFVLPNQAISDSVPLTSFYVPLESIERSAGFFLFEKIPRDAFKKINGVPNNDCKGLPPPPPPALPPPRPPAGG